MRLLIAIVERIEFAKSGASARPSSAAARARLEADRIVVPDGTVLPLRSWLPEGRPRAVVLAIHGFNDHANAFAHPGAIFGAPRICHLRL